MTNEQWTKRMIIILVCWCMIFFAWHVLHVTRLNALAKAILAVENKP